MMEPEEKKVEEVEESKGNEDLKKEVQRILDTAVEEADRLIANARNLFEENKDKVNVESMKAAFKDLTDSLTKTWQDATARLNELGQNPEVKEKVEHSKDALAKTYTSAIAALKSGYESVKDSEELKEKLKEASDFIKEGTEKTVDTVVDAYHQVMKDPKVQETVDKIKDAADKGMDAVKEKMEEPKVQEKMNQLKNGIVDFAEKTTEQLKKWLKTDNKE